MVDRAKAEADRARLLAGRHKHRRVGCRRLVWDGRPPRGVELTQYRDCIEQRGDGRAGGVAGQRQRGDHRRGEGAQVLVAGGKQIEMPVVTRLAILHGPPGGDQPRHANALADQPPGLLVRDGRVGQHVEDLVATPNSDAKATAHFAYRPDRITKSRKQPDSLHC
jgi:hypothetical protein